MVRLLFHIVRIVFRLSFSFGVLSLISCSQSPEAPSGTENSRTASDTQHVTTADYCVTAKTADSATQASRSALSDSSEHAKTADLADVATLANVATSAESCLTAKQADSATSANRAALADLADLATSAKTCDKAKFADSATTAVSCEKSNSANSATTAVSCDKAKTAELATEARICTKASTADLASTATRAISSDNVTGVVSVSNGGTGSTNALDVRRNLGIGTVIVRYGNTTAPVGAPAGTQVITQGWAFSSYYGHAGTSTVECIADQKAAEDRGRATGNYLGKELYPVVTGDAVYLPQQIPAFKKISCSTLFVPGTTTLIKGRGNCPIGWAKIYSGFLLAGHNSHGGGPVDPICVSHSQDFNSQSTDPNNYSRVYGVNTYSSNAVTGHPNRVYLACSYCMKN